MIKGNSVLVIIPARAGSKGLANKNIMKLGDMPLIAYSINAANHSTYLDRIIVSTDSPEIANIAKEYGANVPFLRPAEFAADMSPNSEFILHVLRWLDVNENKSYDILCVLQPTSPFRKSKDIDLSLEKFMNSKSADSLVSINETRRTPYWMKTIDDGGFIRNFIEHKEINSRRQDLPKIYEPNGAIYIMACSDFVKFETFYTSKTTFYLMDQTSSVDIDDILDFKLAELILKENLVELNEVI